MKPSEWEVNLDLESDGFELALEAGAERFVVGLGTQADAKLLLVGRQVERANIQLLEDVTFHHLQICQRLLVA